MDRKRVFIHSEDEELSQKLVRLLDQHGVTAFRLTQEEAEKLERLWQWDACIRGGKGMGRGRRSGLTGLVAIKGGL